MTRKKKAMCTRDDVDTMYSVATDDGYDPPDPAVLDAALTRLAEILNALPDPLDGALAEVTPRDISLLLSRAPLERRRHVLSALGLRLSPRVVSQTLCQNALRLLRQVHLRDAQHAAYLLTQPARALVYAATIATYNETSAVTDADMVSASEFSDTILRLTLWAMVDASVGGARLLQWAGTRQWWLPQGLSAEQGAAVLAAAQAVVDASPAFTFTAPEPAKERLMRYTWDAKTWRPRDATPAELEAVARQQPEPAAQTLDEEHPQTAHTTITLTTEILSGLQCR